MIDIYVGYGAGRRVILSPIISQEAEHEEELMKSDFVKLSWNDSEQYTIPVDAYIIPYDDGVQYSLFEPYNPEQKSECEWKYEPHFQHPKMYLSKVTFKRPSKDSDANDITLLDWTYVGNIYTLLGYFCEQINSVYGFSGSQEIGYEVIGELNQNIATITFSTQDINSALTNTANQCECEWYLDWMARTLYFGRIHFRRSGNIPLLEVGENIGVASVRNSKDGYWNAFEPQGSTRNMTRKATSGEYVLANVRLSLRGEKYPDGIVYTDGYGNIITKAQFDERGEKEYIKSLIFEDVYPKLDLYAYNIRYRERFLLSDPDDLESKVIDHYNGSTPVYKRYAVWYMNLAYPTYDQNGNVTSWTDFDISEVRDMDTTISKIYTNSLEYHSVEMDLAIKVSASFFTTEAQNNLGYVVTLSCDGIEVRGRIESYNFEQDGTCRFYTEWSNGDGLNYHEPDLEKLTAFQNAIADGKTVTFISGVNRKKFPKKYSQIIDGKELYGQFKVNTSENAESTPLAGRGNGDNGNYGFGLIYLGIEGTDYIKEANEEPKEEGDTGIVDMDGNRAEATEKDYEIVFQQSDDYILPTTLSQLIIPKGSRNGNVYVKDLSRLTDKNIGLRGNIVNLYNIVMDSSYEASAKNELENETKKYIATSVEDNNSYTFKSNPIAFSNQFHDPLYIGQKVNYADSKTYTSANPLETRVMKLVTKLDYAFEQEITIGNEILKGSQQSLKEQVQTMVSYGAGGGGGEGGGMSTSEMRQAIKSIGADLFVSKVYNDEAQGFIGLLKGAYYGAKEWFIDTTGSANLFDATINGLLKAYNAIINTVKSTNYTGDGMLDTGWRITDNYDNNTSKATFDYLYVRRKALYEELEIRKISHIGGDFALSPASGRAYRVEYYDADGEQLGVEEMTVPWMLGYKMMLLFSRSMANKYLGRRKKVDRQLKPEELSLVRRVRVYLFSDDGTMKTMSNWTVGAQARCQSFNITEQTDYHGSGQDSDNADVSYWTGRKVQNTYWWRLVSAVGEGTLQDGKRHSYVEFLCNTGNDSVVADTGSDLPAVGDEFCQFGHRTRPELSNVIMIETAREDSPSFKMYAGINSWDLTGKQVSVQSPTGWKVLANSFEWITSYGELFKPTVNRGMWIDIETDSQGKRRCYFNDMVSHNGAYWRCVVNEGTYTIDEPSESSSAWQKEVYAAIAPYLKFSDALVAVPCEKDSKATAALSKTVTVKLMVTNLEATITSITMTNQDSHVYLSGNNVVVSFAKGDSVPNKDYVLTVSGDLSGNHYTATDAISVYAVARGDDAYEVTTSPEIFIFSQQEDSPYAINIDKSENGNSSLKVIVKRDGQDQSFRITAVTASGKDSSGQATTMSATYSNTSKRVWITAIGNTTETGNLNITVSYGNNASQTITVPVYCNLIGTWKEKVVGDTKTEIAEKTQFDVCDATGAVITTQTLGQYIKSSSQNSAELVKTIGGTLDNTTHTYKNSRIDTAESSINTVKHDLYDSTGLLKSNYSTTTQTATMIQNEVASKTQGMVTTSTFKQTADSFSLCTTTQASGYANNAESNAKSAAQGYANTAENNAESYADGVGSAIETKLSETGIIIDGTNRRIDLIGGKVRVLNSSKQAVGKVEITSDGKIKAVDGDFSGKITATEGSIGGFEINVDNSNTLGYIDYTYQNGWVFLKRDGFISVNKLNASYATALDVYGGANIYAGIGIGGGDNSNKIQVNTSGTFIGAGSSAVTHIKGKAYYNSDEIAVKTVSDIRMKDVIEEADVSVDSFADSPLFRFKLKKRPDDRVHIGTSAQYWQDVISDVVEKGAEFDDEGEIVGEHLLLDYTELSYAGVVALAREVKRLREEIEGLKKQN